MNGLFRRLHWTSRRDADDGFSSEDEEADGSTDGVLGDLAVSA